MNEADKEYIEIYNSETGEWTTTDLTEEEILSANDIIRQDADVLAAEYKIIQRVVALHEDKKIDPKSMD